MEELIYDEWSASDLGWSMLRDITRLGNDNHSQIARIKKPDGSRAWDLDDWDIAINKINDILQ